MALLKENVPNEYSARVEFLGHISDISTIAPALFARSGECVAWICLDCRLRKALVLVYL